MKKNRAAVVLLLVCVALLGACKKDISISRDYYDDIAFMVGERAMVVKDGESYLVDVDSGKAVSDKFSDVPYSSDKYYKDEYFCAKLRDGRNAIIDSKTGGSIYVASSGNLTALNCRYAKLTKPNGEIFLYDLQEKKLSDIPLHSAYAVSNAVVVTKKGDQGSDNPYTIMSGGNEYGRYSYVLSRTYGNEVYLICTIYEDSTSKQYMYHADSMKLVYNIGVSSIPYYSYTTVNGVTILDMSTGSDLTVMFFLCGADSYAIEISSAVYSFTAYAAEKKCYALMYRTYSSSNYYLFDVAKNTSVLLMPTGASSYHCGYVTDSDNKIIYYYTNSQYHYLSADGTAYPTSNYMPLYFADGAILTGNEVGGITIDGTKYTTVQVYGDYLFFNNGWSGVVTGKNMGILFKGVSISSQYESGYYVISNNSYPYEYHILYNNIISSAFSYVNNYSMAGMRTYVQLPDETGYRLYDIKANALDGEIYDDISFAKTYKNIEDTDSLAIMRTSEDGKTRTLVKNLSSGSSRIFEYDGVSGETYKECSMTGVITEFYSNGVLTATRIYSATNFELKKEHGVADTYSTANWFAVENKDGIDEYAVVTRAGMYGLIDGSGKTLITAKYAGFGGVVTGVSKSGDFSLLFSRSGNSADTELLNSKGKVLIKSNNGVQSEGSRFVLSVDDNLKVSLHDYSGKTFAEDVLDFDYLSDITDSDASGDRRFYKVFVRGKGYKLLTVSSEGTRCTLSFY